jgi:pyruvate formate lyase activating enzyme
MGKEVTGRVYDIQGFSLQDGPGIRTTVFLKGCPLRCPWCHSPESQQFNTQLSWISVRCIGVQKCGQCLKACSKGAIAPGKWTRHAAAQEDIQLICIDRSICDNCGECIEICSPKALSLCGVDYTPDELLKLLVKDLPFYEHSGGGVTVSGGEPLSQPEFLFQLLKRMRACAIHTAVDTSGYAPYESIERILPFTDLFLYDLKHMDSEQHRMGTNVSNERILENAEKIAKAGGRMQIRIPVIPDFNDSEESIREIGMFCRSLGKAVTILQLLPYHNLGVMKHQRIEDRRIVLEAIPPSDEKIHALQQLLESLGLPVTVH